LLAAVRRRKRLRQVDVAKVGHVSQTMISRAERGRLDGMTFGMLERVAKALDIDLRLEASWHGGAGDRLVDRGHAALVEHVATVLRRRGWEVTVEFTFNHFGERGSVDVLAFHAANRVLLIIEVKTRLTDLQAFLASFGRKLRIVPESARTALGWDSETVGRVLVVTGSTANRSVVRTHRTIFDTTLPARVAELRPWLLDPSGPIGAIWFTAGANPPGSTPKLGEAPAS
jgi:transcriptional regulator with XRE-family HTH domain